MLPSRASDSSASPSTVNRKHATIAFESAKAPPEQSSSLDSNKKTSKSLWFIHGQYYDLTTFVDAHPGGSVILNMTRGEDDVTPLFESYHAFANREYINKSLAKYKIDYVPEDALTRNKTETEYAFDENGFYNTLTNRARELFGAKGNNESVTKNVKANKWWAIKVSFFTVLFLTTYIAAFALPNMDRASSVVLGGLAGLFMFAVGFNAMHDGSHYAIGVRDSWKNKLAMRLWNSVAFWDSSMWYYHHTVRHHAFTGDKDLDPDVVHARPLIRKHLDTPRSEYFNFMPRFLIVERSFWAFWGALYFFNLHVGQIFLYNVQWPLVGTMWNLPLEKTQNMFQKMWWERALSLAVLGLQLYKADILVSAAFFMVASVSYGVCIVPDHDTYESAIENHAHGGRVDWGEIQVRHSSDFGGEGKLGRAFTEMFGSINVQIAHHLFPSVNSVYLPSLVPIIKQTCQEFNVPYAAQVSIWSAVWSFIHTIHFTMGEEKVSSNKSSNKVE